MNSTKLFLILGVAAAFNIAATLAYQDTNKDCVKKESNSTTTYIRTNGDNCTCDGPGKDMFGRPYPRDTAQCESKTTPATTTAKTTATPTTESTTYTEKHNGCNKDNEGKTYTKVGGDTCTCTKSKGYMVVTYDNGVCKRATPATSATTASAAASS